MIHQESKQCGLDDNPCFCGFQRAHGVDQYVIETVFAVVSGIVVFNGEYRDRARLYEKIGDHDKAKADLEKAK